MRFELTARSVPVGAAAEWARSVEAAGFDGIWTTEAAHDPFVPLALAATATRRLSLGTGVAVALPRNPVQLAAAAWDLHALSGGRFRLGLGAQVRAHLERRFGVDGSRPAHRMRELVLAVRAIWHAWADGSDLDFRGEFYTHTLMPPAFRPERLDGPAPQVWLAAVQERMLEVAGEVADGVLVHPLHTPLYLREVVLPALARGGDTAPAIVAALLVATDDAGLERVRNRIAFYGSTPGYRRVLELHGFAELGEELHARSRAGAWDEMARLVPDELVAEVAVVESDPAAATAAIEARYDGLAQGVNLQLEDDTELEWWGAAIAGRS